MTTHATHYREKFAYSRPCAKVREFQAPSR
jgi:hypothetical protein